MKRKLQRQLVEKPLADNRIKRMQQQKRRKKFFTREVWVLEETGKTIQKEKTRKESFLLVEKNVCVGFRGGKGPTRNKPF